jgi:hypothetical protein
MRQRESSLRGKADPNWKQSGPTGPPGRKGRSVSYAFYFFIFFSFSKPFSKWILNPNQIKSKPHHTIKQMR